ncbi:hypothetical protein NML43_08935 [Rhodopseudomonas palustris]|uniref:DUF5672 family protein n=1 Tax=Rhodopseudomonas palustris TaxID=1076 RepID=UPI0020CD0CE9|nr:DUF5672 family protein [Rhodopseudomonas palustris]MCP9627209.1 hypothetical protein [Rhodopseudomonas palustris]
MPAVNPVVVVPVYKENTETEAQTSLRHLRRFLGRYRLVLAKPAHLAWSVDGLENEVFPDESFQSLHGYNRLLLSTSFYRRFAQHSHVLIYQLDALAFRDELIEWCETDYDYIGASWYPHLIEKYIGEPWPFAKVGAGNGGFSLRRVSAFITHLEKRRSTLRHAFDRLLDGNFDAASRLWRHRRHLTPSNYVQHKMLAEDVYWGVFAPLIDPSFRVAPVEVANRFSFEYDPNFLLQQSGGRIPFGCHAWYRFEDARAFWQSRLLPPDGDPA